MMIGRDELTQIAISVLAISVAITIADMSHSCSGFACGLKQFVSLSLSQSAAFLGVILLTVGIGFILHEMAHKFVAIRFGAFAAFKSWPEGLALALVMSLFGFVFVAPGAVYIYSPYLTRKQNGLISVAGPLMNIAIAAAFFLIYTFALGAAVVSPTNFASVGGLLTGIAAMGVQVNLWLALFNMIPIFPLDGSKVMAWNAWIWAVITLPLVVFLFF